MDFGSSARSNNVINEYNGSYLAVISQHSPNVVTEYSIVYIDVVLLRINPGARHSTLGRR